MKAQSFKKAILQLAVQGKLVAQNPQDEPASNLLKKIRVEKVKLIKEKKIKAEEPLAPINGEEKPFDIPDSWEWVRLGELCSYIQRGKSPKYTEIQKIPVVAQKCNQWDGFSLNKAKFIEPDSISAYAEERLLQDCDLMWNSTGLGTLGRIAMYESRLNPYGIAVADSYVTVIRPIKKYVSNTYLLKYFSSPCVQSVIEDKSDGSTKQKELATATIKNYIIPLPPLEEQQRIVEKIEQLMPIVEKYDIYEKELTTLEAKFPDKLKKSVLQFAVQGKLLPQNPQDEPANELLKKIKIEKARLIKEKKIKAEKPLPAITDKEKPFDIPDSWEWVRLADIGSWGSGATPSRTNAAFYNGNIPWLKTGDLTDGYIYEIPEFVSELALEKTSLRLNDSDSVLIAMYGATIGKLGMLTFPATTNQACCACSVFSNVFNKYLFYFLLSQRDNFKSISEGGAQPNISKEKILNYVFPLPPFAEQKRIASKVEQMISLCDVLADESKLKQYQPPKRLAKVIEFIPVVTEDEPEHLVAARADEISPETRAKEQERLAFLRNKR